MDKSQSDKTCVVHLRELPVEGGEAGNTLLQLRGRGWFAKVASCDRSYMLFTTFVYSTARKYSHSHALFYHS